MLRTDGSDGGPAFPISRDDILRGANPGMSLRDYAAIQFGAAVFGGYCAAGMNTEEGAIAVVAKASYLFADAMIAERLK